MTTTYAGPSGEERLVKKIINSADAVVDESVAGMAKAHPDLVRATFDPTYVTRTEAPRAGKVALVSGGGSGHEPLHGGYVGRGMLDAAVPGPVFTSPTPDPIAAAMKDTDGGAGTLLVVKNYTGDVLNFETAAELAGADGITAESVVIDDDVAVRDSLYTAGRRGVGGTVLLEKIAGAAAERGDDLAGVKAIAERVIGGVRSMGMALSPCTVPHAGTPTFELGDNEMEIGIGIHGEPGRERLPVEPADAIVERLLAPILTDLPYSSGDEVLLFVNGMGGTPLLELYLAYGHAQDVLAEHGITVTRCLVGNYITSLEMQGMSLTLLRMDEELTELWDAPVHTPALQWGA